MTLDTFYKNSCRIFGAHSQSRTIPVSDSLSLDVLCNSTRTAIYFQKKIVSSYVILCVQSEETLNPIHSRSAAFPPRIASPSHTYHMLQHIKPHRSECAICNQISVEERHAENNSRNCVQGHIKVHQVPPPQLIHRSCRRSGNWTKSRRNLSHFDEDIHIRRFSRAWTVKRVTSQPADESCNLRHIVHGDKKKNKVVHVESSLSCLALRPMSDLITQSLASSCSRHSGNLRRLFKIWGGFLLILAVVVVSINYIGRP